MRLRELDFEVTHFNDLTFNEMQNRIMECKLPTENISVKCSLTC